MNSPLVPLGRPRAERADAARNRAQLLTTAREMMAELGVEKVTMDGSRSGRDSASGHGLPPLRHAGRDLPRAADDDEHVFQEQVSAGRRRSGRAPSRSPAHRHGRAAPLSTRGPPGDRPRLSLDRTNRKSARRGGRHPDAHAPPPAPAPRPPDATDVDTSPCSSRRRWRGRSCSTSRHPGPRSSPAPGRGPARRRGWQRLVESICRTDPPPAGTLSAPGLPLGPGATAALPCRSALLLEHVVELLVEVHGVLRRAAVGMWIASADRSPDRPRRTPAARPCCSRTRRPFPGVPRRFQLRPLRPQPASRTSATRATAVVATGLTRAPG